MSLGTLSSSSLKYWANFFQFLISALGSFSREEKELLFQAWFSLVFSPLPPAFPLLLKSSFPYNPGASFLPCRGILACGYVCGHSSLCFWQQNVLRINKILCRGHTTSSRPCISHEGVKCCHIDSWSVLALLKLTDVDLHKICLWQRPRSVLYFSLHFFFLLQPEPSLTVVIFTIASKSASRYFGHAYASLPFEYLECF